MKPTESVQSRSFRPAFDQIAAIVAIGEIRDRAETLRRLIAVCISELSSDGLSNGGEVSATLDQLYGLRVPAAISQQALNDLLARGDLIQKGRHLVLRPQVRSEMQARVAAAQALEGRVRDRWLDEVGTAERSVSPDVLWSALKAYLFRAFRRHGIQAAALLDPHIDVAPEYTESLSSLLGEAVAEVVPQPHRERVRTLIAGFLARAGEERERSAYITQLADGTFSYFSLTVAPEAAASLKAQLQPLKVFLDTNFLFGLLKLGEHVWGDLTDELIDLTQTAGLPFELLYHERTDREVNGSIQYYESYLVGRTWGNGVARAALKTRNVSGITRQYLGEYLRTGVDVRTFFRPFKHVDELLTAKGIGAYHPAEERQEARAEVYHAYQQYLDSSSPWWK